MCKVNVLDFGVVPNSDKVQSLGFQAAIDECFKSGGGEVIVPEGCYVIGDIRLRSNINFHLLKNAVIKGSIDPKDYMNVYDDELEPLPEEDKNRLKWQSAATRTVEYGRAMLDACGSYWHYGMIRILYAENVAITGEEGCVIDGQNCYDPEGEEEYRGPHGINAHHSKNLYFSGYTIKDSGNWAHCIMRCQNITVENIKVLAGHDGVHFRGCDNCLVKNCEVRTGDDAIAGFDNINVHVKDCLLSSACSSFRFGGRNVLIENVRSIAPCEFVFRGSLTKEEKAGRVQNSESGRKNNVSFFTYFVDPSRDLRYPQGNIIIKDCEIINADRMLRLNLSGAEVWQRGMPPTDILFENIDVKGACLPINAYGDGKFPFEVTFKNIRHTFREGFEKTAFINLGNYDKATFENVTINNFSGDELVRTWGDADKIILKNFVCEGITNEKLIGKREDAFDNRFA